MRIAVYCSARPEIPEQFHQDARDFGKWIGENRHELVYGGLAYSMMSDVAQACADAGGKVIGLVPQSRLDHQHPANTVSIHVETLHERKQMMEENSDVFVALEGGVGTLDEVFAAIASCAFFKQTKEVHMLDRNGLYQPLKQLLENMAQLKLCAMPDNLGIYFHPNLKSLTEALTKLSATIG